MQGMITYSSGQKSDGLYSLDLPQDFPAGSQRVGPALFGATSYGRVAT
jgi:hypothetical protein